MAYWSPYWRPWRPFLIRTLFWLADFEWGGTHFNGYTSRARGRIWNASVYSLVCYVLDGQEPTQWPAFLLAPSAPSSSRSGFIGAPTAPFVREYSLSCEGFRVTTISLSEWLRGETSVCPLSAQECLCLYVTFSEYSHAANFRREVLLDLLVEILLEKKKEELEDSSSETQAKYE